MLANPYELQSEKPYKRPASDELMFSDLGGRKTTAMQTAAQ